MFCESDDMLISSILFQEIHAINPLISTSFVTLHTSFPKFTTLGNHE